MKKQRELEEQLYIVGWFFLILGGISSLIYIYWIVPNFEMPPCMWWNVLGIYCPGCGGTRAVMALLHGDFLLSFWYHPLVIYTAVIFGGFMLTQTLQRLKLFGIRGWKFHVWHMIGAVAIMTVNFILKNVLLFSFDIRL